jgi:hypothetical protein
VVAKEKREAINTAYLGFPFLLLKFGVFIHVPMYRRYKKGTKKDLLVSKSKLYSVV